MDNTVLSLHHPPRPSSEIGTLKGTLLISCIFHHQNRPIIISLTSLQNDFYNNHDYENFHHHHQWLSDIMQIRLTRHHSGPSHPAEPKGLHHYKIIINWKL